MQNCGRKTSNTPCSACVNDVDDLPRLASATANSTSSSYEDWCNSFRIKQSLLMLLAVAKSVPLEPLLWTLNSLRLSFRRCIDAIRRHQHPSVYGTRVPPAAGVTRKNVLTCSRGDGAGFETIDEGPIPHMNPTGWIVDKSRTRSDDDDYRMLSKHAAASAGPSRCLNPHCEVDEKRRSLHAILSYAALWIVTVGCRRHRMRRESVNPPASVERTLTLHGAVKRDCGTRFHSCVARAAAHEVHLSRRSDDASEFSVADAVVGAASAAAAAALTVWETKIPTGVVLRRRWKVGR